MTGTVTLTRRERQRAATVEEIKEFARGLMRDLFSEKVESVVVDSKQVFNEISEYLKGIAPELMDRVKLHEDPVPVFDKYDIETEIRDLFKRRCDLPSGGYLIIGATVCSGDFGSARARPPRRPLPGRATTPPCSRPVPRFATPAAASRT